MAFCNDSTKFIAHNLVINQITLDTVFVSVGFLAQNITVDIILVTQDEIDGV